MRLYEWPNIIHQAMDLEGKLIWDDSAGYTVAITNVIIDIAAGMSSQLQILTIRIEGLDYSGRQIAVLRTV